MLKKSFRLNKTRDIEAVMKKGRAYYAPILMLKILANQLEQSRFTVIVSNRVSKKASQRNLAKRRIREVVRLSWPSIKPGADLIVLASPKIIEAPGKVKAYAEIKQAIERLFSQARLWQQ